MGGPSRTMIAKRWVPILTKLYNHDASHIVKNLQCFACGRAGVLDRAHIVPRHKGGSDDLSNLHLLCKSCHAESDLFHGRQYWRWFRFQIRTAFARRVQLSMAIGEPDCEHHHAELKRMADVGAQNAKRPQRKPPQYQQATRGAILRAEKNYERLRPHLTQAIEEGYTTGRSIATYLNNKGILSPRCAQWSHTTVNRMIRRLGLFTRGTK